VCVGPDAHLRVQTSRGHDEQLAVHLNLRQGRSADTAEALAVSGARQIELPDFVLSRSPLQGCRRREQVGAVRRSGVFAAVLAVTQVKLLEFAVDFEAHRAAQAGARMLVFH
jgi:hypothetical protein